MIEGWSSIPAAQCVVQSSPIEKIIASTKLRYTDQNYFSTLNSLNHSLQNMGHVRTENAYAQENMALWTRRVNVIKPRFYLLLVRLERQISGNYILELNFWEYISFRTLILPWCLYAPIFCRISHSFLNYFSGYKIKFLVTAYLK
jgi:hypothetical protein